MSYMILLGWYEKQTEVQANILRCTLQICPQNKQNLLKKIKSILARFNNEK